MKTGRGERRVLECSECIGCNMSLWSKRVPSEGAIRVRSEGWCCHYHLSEVMERLRGESVLMVEVHFVG